MRDYHNLYIGSDVAMLGDIFGDFRNNSIENYKLDPAHCPMSQFERVQLQLFSDPDMLLIF